MEVYVEVEGIERNIDVDDGLSIARIAHLPFPTISELLCFLLIQTAERTNVEGVAIMVYRATRAEDSKDTVELRLRDPTIFQNSLRNLSSSGSSDDPVTTQVAPGGDTTQRNSDGSVKRERSVTQQEDQRLSVEQLIPPKLCNRGAETDDLLEISYVGRVLETGAIFDGSAVKINGEGIAGRGNDVSIFFVLGKQPFGTSLFRR